MTSGQDERSAVDIRAGALGASAMSLNVVHGTFRCRRGYDLYTTTYIPAVRRTTACLIFHHGLSDHAERHAPVLAHLCSSLGMPIYTYDAHGHGRSGPDGPVGRALMRTHQHMVADLIDFTRLFVAKAEEEKEEEAQGGAAVAAAAAAAAHSDDAGSAHQHQQAARQRRRRPRVFLLGYSMGGLVTSLAVAQTTPAAAAAPSVTSPLMNGSTSSDSAAAAAAGTAATTSAESADGSDGGGGLYEGLMLTSGLTDPLYGNHPVLRAIKIAYVTTLSYLAPALPLFKRNPVETGIRDPAAVAAMADDMLWYRGRFKVATVASLLSGCAALRRTARRLSAVPLYVQHATVDTSCSLASMHAHLARVRPADLTMHVVQGAFHDLHHDPETPVLLGRMVEWLKKRV